MKNHWKITPGVKAAIIVGLAVLASGRSPGGLARPSVAGSSAAVPVLRAFDPAMMDTRVSVCTNLFQFADGNWVKQNPIPPASSEWGRAMELRIKNRDELRGILEQAARDRTAAPGSNTQKLGDFYASCMDRPAIERAGVKPLQPEFDRINAIDDVKSLENEIARLKRMEVNAVFAFGSTQEEMTAPR